MVCCAGNGRGEIALESDSRAAKISLALGVIGAAACAAGPALAQLEATSPFTAFRVFAAGLLLALLALLFGAVGLWRTRPAARRRGRRPALVGTALGLVPVAIAAAVIGSAGGAPAINDITTNPDDPPHLRAAQTDDANTGRDLTYPGEEFARAQRAAYPDLAPIRVAGAPEDVYARCVTAARGLGWKLTLEDPAAGVFEAIAVTRVFRFVDDIAVRVRAAGDGSVVDVRSKSRDGKGDLGANAARIRAFRDAIRSSGPGGGEAAATKSCGPGPGKAGATPLRSPAARCARFALAGLVVARLQLV